MPTSRRPSRALASVYIVVGVIATSVLSGTAIAVTSGGFTYSPPRTGHVMIGVGDLVPADELDANDYFLHPFYGAISGSDTCFRAGVHLPRGAVITTMKTWYTSGSGSQLSYELGRTDVRDASHDVLAAREVIDDTDGRSAVTDTVDDPLATVNNAVYAYTLTMCIGPSTDFYASRITYTYTSAGD